MTRARLVSHAIVVGGLLLTAATAYAGDGCRFDEITEHNPTGWIGCEQYGVGTASTWGGPGVAVNACVYPWTDCKPLRITSLDTGHSVVVTPTMYCNCWVNGTGPNGETARLVDLDPASVAALGLPGPGLWRVEVQPAGSEPVVTAAAPTPGMLPDTGMGQ